MPVIDKSIITDDKHDEANPLILPTGGAKKKKVKKVIKPKRKILSKKQQKKLEAVLKRRSKNQDRKQALEELSKYTLSTDVLKKLQADLPKHSGRRGKKSKNKHVEDDESDGNQEKPYDSSSPLKKKFKIPEPDAVVELNDSNVISYQRQREQENESEHDSNDDGTGPEERRKPRKVTENDDNNIKKYVKIASPEALVKIASVIKPTVNVALNRTSEIEDARSQLPIIGEEQAIVECIRYNDVVIICGETGSGKTTQVPQFLYEAGYASTSEPDQKKIICITEPRRVAAISMSKRVGHEMNLSNVVSYHIRYDHNVTKDTRVKFVTDGVLLKEIQRNFTLDNYSVVIIDEAHERSVFSDILIGLLSRIVNLRRKYNDPLKLIIMSATLRVDDFARNPRLFKNPPPLLKVESRQFPVTIHFSKNTPDNYLNGALAKVSKIHRSQSSGGILVFVTGRNDVTTLVKKLRKMFPASDDKQEKMFTEDKQQDKSFTNRFQMKTQKSKAKVFGDMLPKISLDDFTEDNTFAEENQDSDAESDQQEDASDVGKRVFGDEMKHQPLYCLPLYSLLSKDRQDLVFKPPPEGHRLCVVATNVAETSLTIPGIKYVVDTGKVKKKVYDKTTGISAFIVSWTSKASADQRSGRAGRTCPGHSYRLYSSAVYTNDFPDFSEPEIASKPIDDLVLQMKSLDIVNVDNFPFPTAPSAESLIASEKRLIMMGALQEIKTKVCVTGRKATSLTSLGRVMAQFPVSPRYGRMLSFAYNELLPYVVALVAGLTVQEIFLSTVPAQFFSENESTDAKSLQQKWNALRRRWSGTGNSRLLGDLTLMLKAIGASEFTGASFSFSVQNGISHKAMNEIHKLRKQLTQEVNRVLNYSIPLTLTPPDDLDTKHLRMIALAGFFDHVAKKSVSPDPKINKKRPYQSTQTDEFVFIDPQSILNQESPEWVVYQEIHETSKMFMRNVVAIEPSWLPIYSRNLCHLSDPLEDPSPFFDTERDSVMCYVEGTFGPHAWTLPVSVIEFPETQERFKWFARLFLEGFVIPFLKEFQGSYLSSPKILLKSWSNLLPKLMSIHKILQRNRISSLLSLKSRWKTDGEFLLAEVKEWLPVSKHFDLEEAWKKNIRTDGED